MLLAYLFLACGTSTPETPPPEPGEAPPPVATKRLIDPADEALPDIVVITLDTTRADHLGTYGYFRDTSPNLDAFASTSLVFDNLIVPMATTLPTHTSLFTSTWPEEHGVRANVLHDGSKFIQSDQLISFASWARDHGYQTAGFVSAAPLRGGDSGISVGFDVFDEPPRARAERIGNVTVDQAVAWLSGAETSPMLLWIHMFDPHNPFRPPKEYAARFKTDNALRKWIADREVVKKARRPSGEVVYALGATNAYDAEIAFMDDQFQRVMDALQTRGRTDNTLFVVMGDHGEGLNQHGQPGHGLVWGEQLSAPLFIRAPGVTPRRVDTLLSAADVLPTALSMVDLPVTPFLEQATGTNVLADDFTERPVLSQVSDRQLGLGKPKTYALTGRDHKCTWHENGEPKLYQRADDPFELKDVAAEQPEVAEACAKELRAIVAAQIAKGKSIGAGKTEEMSEDQFEALRALGYLEDDAEPME
jgi:arylsulfatase A-like enzyme